MLDISRILKTDDEITANVRTRTFSGAYVMKEHVFTVKTMGEKFIYGMTVTDGSEAYIPYNWVTKINGMDIDRLLKSTKKMIDIFEN